MRKDCLKNSGRHQILGERLTGEWRVFFWFLHSFKKILKKFTTINNSFIIYLS